MSDSRTAHLVERAVERMAELGIVPPGAPLVAPGTTPGNVLGNVSGNIPAAVSLDGAFGGSREAPLDNAPLDNALLGGARDTGGTGDTDTLPSPTRPSPERPQANDPATASPDARPVTASPGAASPGAASMVEMATLETSGMVVAGGRRSRVAEEWNVTASRLLRTQRTLKRNPTGHAAANVLMITSSKPNEGKSFSALNLAGSLTLGGMAEVLLLDTDSKPGALSELLGLADRVGLFDLAADPSLRVEDLVLTTAIANLSILPIGRAARGGSGAAERTVTRPVMVAIENVARRFPNRIVILDSAPCLATSDAATLAGSVGQIAMIVEAERTQRDDLEAALELLRPCANITLVLNKVRQTTTHAFGDYDYYNG